jgi:DNA modification methylase
MDTIDLDFSNQNTLYGSHGLHPFAAKCPPQLARWAIEHFSKAGETVLDPMAGSGTTLVEARLLGRNALGMDIDPLARLLSEVKSTPIEPDRLKKAVAALLERVGKDFERLESAGNGQLPADLAARCQPPQIDRLDYWFLPDVIKGLSLIKYHILNEDMAVELRDFFLAAFSSLILARTSVANARDIVHSRHHYQKHELPPDVYARLRQRLGTMTRMMGDFWKRCLEIPDSAVGTKIIGSDARTIGLPDGSVDLVFTSPPYCSALDYTRAHQLAVAWLQDVFSVSQVEYALLGRQYIGTGRAMKSSGALARIVLPDVPLFREVADRVGATDAHKGNTVKRYFADMQQVLSEMGRVLKPGRHLVLVVCPSHIRKVDIPTHEIFGQIIEKLALDGGCRLTRVACIERTIDDRRRLLPYMQKAFGRRMRTEYVVIYEKTSSMGQTLKRVPDEGDCTIGPSIAG